MTVVGWMISGFVATLVMTTLLSGSQAVGLTRMNVPFLLGTMLTPNRDRAKVVGFAMHLVNGWLVALLYVALFAQWAPPTWWRGAIVGVGQAIVVLVVGMSLLPAVHPRMASEQEGPSAKRPLEPPGFLALHYGARTPVTVVLAHAVYGALLGGLLRA